MAHETVEVVIKLSDVATEVLGLLALTEQMIEVVPDYVPERDELIAGYKRLHRAFMGAMSDASTRRV